ncbi:MAG: hypothetical protein HY900_11230 [Deltaproteobacteria bacterium]|nr:hypothetical protein [Deltaproteobacteria bacterium]
MKTTMKTIIAALVLALTTAWALPVGTEDRALAADTPVSEALLHTREAIAEAQEGRAEGLMAHAKEALDSARGANMAPDVAEAIKHLERAVLAGQAGDAASGLLHAMQAEQHLASAAG